MSDTKAVIVYMLVMATLAAFFLSAAPIALWVRWVLAGIVAGVEIGIPVSAAAGRYRRLRQYRRRYNP